MSHFRYLIVFLLALYNPCTATATATAKAIKSTASSTETRTGNCDDTPIPDPVAQFESLPEHVKLAEQVTGYNQPSRATCQSKQFKYTAIRENNQVRVVSFYRQNGHPHAIYIVAKNDQTAYWMGDGYRKAPNEITTHTPPVQALAVELMPEPFRAWLADVSHRMQTPPDFAVISAIVITGSLIGAGCGMRPKRLDDWEVIPNLWGACIGRPSVVLKSPSMKEPMALLESLQAQYGEQFERDKAAAEFDKMATEAMLDDVKSQLKKTAKGKGKGGVVNTGDIAKLKADYMELTENAEPKATRRMLKTNETSIQSMTVLQNENPRGLLVYRDELMGLLASWDKDDKADERAYFLEGWNGNSSYTDVKIGRGLTDAKNVCISLLGGIQPDKLSRYLHQALHGDNDGLMQRLQLAVWPDEPEHWQLIDTAPNKDGKQKASKILEALAELDFIGHGAVQGDYDDRPFFRFDADAQAVFNEWLTVLQTFKIKQEENPLMGEHFGKFRSLMPSLALIFHCIDMADGKARGNVSAQSARLAVAWCEYLESHARRIYAMAQSPEQEAAVKLAGKIKAKSVAESIYRPRY